MNNTNGEIENDVTTYSSGIGSDSGSGFVTSLTSTGLANAKVVANAGN